MCALVYVERAVCMCIEENSVSYQYGRGFSLSKDSFFVVNNIVDFLLQQQRIES